MSEFHRLRAYLESKGTFTEEEFAFLEPLYLPRSLRAGEFLQRAGEPATYGAFVATGCLRKYVVDWTPSKKSLKGQRGVEIRVPLSKNTSC